MTKTEIIEKLTALHIEHDPEASKKDLEALLPVDESSDDEESGDTATVTWPGGSRVYSKELHGKDFRKLAKQFAEKFSGTVK